jgi:alkylation response protein AidB-like acyl-CoA dehydrogenase
VPEKYRPADVPGLAGIPVADLNIFHLLAMTDETSRVEGGVMTALAGASAIGPLPIINHGTEEQKQKWLPGLFDFEPSFCLGITEPSGGSDVANIQTTAETPDGKSYVVNGYKKWITGAPWAIHMTIAVRTGGEGMKGISVLVIPRVSCGVGYQTVDRKPAELVSLNLMCLSL